eukprot:2493553-Amphidinium_carterae.1
MFGFVAVLRSCLAACCHSAERFAHGSGRRPPASEKSLPRASGTRNDPKAPPKKGHERKANLRQSCPQVKII